MALAKNGDEARAEAEFRRTLLLDPEMAAAHIELGLLLALKAGGVSGQARSELNEGLRLDSRLRSLIPENLLRDLR